MGWIKTGVWIIFIGVGLTVWAEEPKFEFSARVDKTAVETGQAIQLTLTLSGDLSGVELSSIEFPEEFMVASRSQSSSVSVHPKATRRSILLAYALIPQHEGTYQVGPFEAKYDGKTISTKPIHVTVKKSTLPPSLKQQPTERFVL
ncbi:MAG: BatD family protein [Candidatus Omnitrophica bacterium]|nr:BatD family protein [Candidatus Omnitrophota bacterium]